MPFFLLYYIPPSTRTRTPIRNGHQITYRENVNWAAPLGNFIEMRNEMGFGGAEGDIDYLLFVGAMGGRAKRGEFPEENPTE